MRFWKSQEERDAEILRKYRARELDVGNYPGSLPNMRQKANIKALEAAALREAEKGPYPIHGRNTMQPRLPFTWFRCNNGHREMGSPIAKPERDCMQCEMGAMMARFDKREAPTFTGWEPLGEDGAFSAIVELESSEFYARTREGL